mgnify:FL=1
MVVTAKSNSEAYREAFKSKAKAESVHVEASKLMAKPNVALRVQELRDELAESILWTRKDSLLTLAAIARGEDEDAKPSDKVNAVKVINSMYGWDKQVIEQTTTHRMEKTLAERLKGGSKR